MIKLLNKYDTNLANYVICHLELLNDIKIELDSIKNNCNLYSPPINTEERQGHRVLRLIPKRQDNVIDT